MQTPERLRTMSARQLTIRILRYNPQEPGSTPRMQEYVVEEADGMTLFIALEEIRERQDPSLQYDFVCRAGICGSCAMTINGRPTLACRTLTRNLGTTITLAPLPGFELIADLSVDTGKWMRGMSERLESWLHMREENPDLTKLEERMEPKLAQEIYELDRCIECGCCVAACGTARMRKDFVGAVGLNKIARFRLDPRDTRGDQEFYELVGDDNGVFGCMSLLACHDVCPKDLPLVTQIAFIRRKMVTSGLREGKTGAGCRDRTRDPLITKRIPYSLRLFGVDDWEPKWLFVWIRLRAGAGAGAGAGISMRASASFFTTAMCSALSMVRPRA